MANPNSVKKANEVSEVSENENDEVVGNFAVGKVSTKVKHPLTRQEIKLTGDFKVPQAKDENEMINQNGGIMEDVVFWHNYGKRIYARQLAMQSLGLDLGSDELNELYRSFEAAMDAMYVKDMSEARLKKIQEFILSEEKFDQLRNKITDFTPDHKTFDFSQIELKKPDGKRGPKAKVKEETPAA